MKKTIAIAIVLSLLSATSAQAFFYDAKCMVPEGKLKKCSIDFSKRDSMQVHYKDLQYQSLNREIRGRDIMNISVGEQAKLRWGTTAAAIYAFGPVGALTLLWKKKMEMFGIEYKEGRESESVLFSVKEKIGFQVMQQLHEISGQAAHTDRGSGTKISQR